MKYICIDFDGTIVEHEYPRIGPEVPGALKYMTYWQSMGMKLILFTMRSGEQLDEAVAYLTANGIDLFGINHNPDQEEWTTSPKAYGHIYIDDAAFGCPLVFQVGTRPYVDWTIVGPQVSMMLLPIEIVNK